MKSEIQPYHQRLEALLDGFNLTCRSIRQTSKTAGTGGSVGLIVRMAARAGGVTRVRVTARVAHRGVVTASAVTVSMAKGKQSPAQMNR